MSEVGAGTCDLSTTVNCGYTICSGSDGPACDDTVAEAARDSPSPSVAGVGALDSPKGPSSFSASGIMLGGPPAPIYGMSLVAMWVLP